MIDTSFFRNNGFQYFPAVISREIIEAIHDLLQAEKQAVLELIGQLSGPCDESELVSKTRALLLDSNTDTRLLRVLRGEYPLPVRLNPVLQRITTEPRLLALLGGVFEERALRMHMPPMARFVLPGNNLAAVPAHNDLKFNTHLEDFVTAWMPLVAIDEQCAGVGIYEGLFQDPGLQAYNPNAAWGEALTIEGIEPTQRAMEPGDLLLMRSNQVHCSMPNRSKRTRYSVDYRFFASPNRSFKHYLDLSTGEIVPPADQQDLRGK